jgi:DNA repair protein RadA/Sms
LNIAGGLRIDDPAADLAVAAAILSSNEDLPVSRRYALIGEIGLGGEIRSVSHLNQRLSELERLGYEKAFISSHNKMEGIKSSIECVREGRIDRILDRLFS